MSRSYSLNHAMIDDEQARQAQEYADNFGLPGYQEVDRMYIEQSYGGYSEENQETWQLLYNRQMEYLAQNASQVYLDGAATICLGRERIPELDQINSRLGPLTGWRSKAVPGYLPTRAFFSCLARREFPTTIVIRPQDSIDYLPEPDIFHDVFGHVPLHADPDFGDFLQTFGEAAAAADECYTDALARLFWFTVEFGLITEGGGVKVYGSGLISSPGESRHALQSRQVKHRGFNLEEVCATPFEIDHYQPVLFVLESFGQLRDSMNAFAARLRQGARPVAV